MSGVALNIQGREIEHFSNYFEALPPEKIDFIFSFLNVPQLCIAALVCKRWTAISAESSLWKSLNLKVGLQLLTQSEQTPKQVYIDFCISRFIKLIKRFPTDCFSYIFSFLTFRELCVTALVCKRWNVISSSSMRWTSFPLKIWPHLYAQTGITKKQLSICTTVDINEAHVDPIYLIYTTKDQSSVHVINRTTLEKRIFDVGLSAFLIKRYKNLIFIASQDGNIEAWDLNTNQCRYKLSIGKKILKNLEFNDHFLACAEDNEGERSQIYVMNLRDGKDMRVINITDLSSFKLIKKQLYCHRLGRPSLIFTDLVFDQSKQGINLRREINPKEGINPGLYYAYNNSYLAVEAIEDLESFYVERENKNDQGNLKRGGYDVSLQAGINIPKHSIVLRNLEDDKLFKISDPHPGPICFLKFVNTKSFLISASLDGTVKCWNYQTQKSISFKHPNCMDIAVCEKTGRLATVSFSKIQIWDLDEQKCLCSIDSPFDDVEKYKSIKVKIHENELIVFSSQGKMTIWTMGQVKT